MKPIRTHKAVWGVAAALLLGAAAAPTFAASHRDAPGQLGDPDANITDVYAFVTANDTVTLILNFHPFIDPDEGPIWSFPSPDVLYEIHVKNDATLASGSPVFTGKANISYQIRFSPPAYQNEGTVLTQGRGTGLSFGDIKAVGDGLQNTIQTFSVTRVDEGTGARTPLDSTRAMILPPPNAGKKVTPLYNDASGFALPGAQTEAQLDKYTKDAIYDLGGGRRVFAGMREEGFFFDQGGFSDLLNLRTPGIDSFVGLNVLSIVLQVPKADLLATGANAVPIVGVYATTNRRLFSVRRPITQDGQVQSFNVGSFQTVSRMGNPGFNEALVAILKKDRYNQVRVEETNDEEFRTYAENPELAVLINAAVLGSADPVAGPIKTSGRTDLSAIFIPDLLKVDLSTAAVPLAGQTGFNRLSVFGGDTIQSPFQNKLIPSGWPNGRRLGDDVIDIALTAIGSQGTLPAGTVLSDNANSNDVTYPLVFPYEGVPHSAINHRHHGQPAAPAPLSFQALPTPNSKPRFSPLRKDR